MGAVDGQVEVHRLATHVGAELIGVDLATGDTDEVSQVLRSALAEHHLVIARDQHVGPARLLELAAGFGEPRRASGAGAAGFPEVDEIVTADGQSPDAFHFDGSYEAVPPSAALMTLVDAPAVGGDLLCASTPALYDALSAPMQQLVDGLRVVYEVRRTDDPDLRAEHPLVRVHPETGRRCLSFDALFSREVVGLHRRESDSLLGFLRSHVAEPSFACRHRWRVGDFVMYDNRTTVHRSTSDYVGTRVTRRVTLAGESVVAPAGR